MGMMGRAAYLPLISPSFAPDLVGSARLRGREVLVFHLPRVVERVERGVPDEERQGPGAHLSVDLPRVIGAHGRYVRRSVLPKLFECQRRVVLEQQPDLLREVEARD